MHFHAAVLPALHQFLKERLSLLAAGSTAPLSANWEKIAQSFIAREPILSKLSSEEVSILFIGLLPNLEPDFLNTTIMEIFPGGGDLPMIGGVKGVNHRGLLPTGETVLAIIAGEDMASRLRIQALLQADAPLVREGLLYLEALREGEPSMSGRVIIPQSIIEQLLYGYEAAPRFGPEFPAKQVITAMDWEDVVLPPATFQQIEDIGSWLEHQSSVMKDPNLARKIKPGYRVLFYGPSGTGKTLTAALLGKQHQKDVYRIDLSQIVSKYIGETEKNLETVFRRAERKDWILFFDEADALFGKRTSVQSAHDKYANQEVSYLLQRVEDYNGLLILASNFRNNLDDAFIRRFHAIVHFPAPNAQERHLLWKKSLPETMPQDSSVDLFELSAHYELTGAGILNAVHYAVLSGYKSGSHQLSQKSLMDGIRKEFLKEEKSI